MSHVARKPDFGAADRVQHKPGCAASDDHWRLDISDLEVEGLYNLCGENKGADQCAVTAQLICGFVFAYAKSRFSHQAARIM